MDLHEKCQGFLRGLVFFHGGGGTLPPWLTFSRQSRCDLFLLERKYGSPGRPQAICFEGCVGRGCGRGDKGDIVGTGSPAAEAGRGYCSQLSAPAPGPGPGKRSRALSLTLPPSPALPSATARPALLPFPDPFGLKHMELNQIDARHHK